MRLLAAVTAAATFGCLVAAAYLPAPWWFAALYAVPLFAVWFAIATAAALLELQLGAGFRAAAPAVASALALFAALYALFERAPGVLGPGLPMQELADKALSVAALAAAIAGLPLAGFGLRAPQLAAQLLATLAMAGSAFALGATARALGVPFLSPWALALATLGGGVYVLTARRGPRDEPARGEPDGERQ